ncbi:ParB/RepB/Spo0J family partition protein [Methylotuvimicrobium sp. KM1]|uniref:ParB/RepB/Spo0J family partition protein n=1 Tax=Methylotuvimicrobium sp. KM1 TaxID=3377707 RepID=UPI00384EFF1F
MAKDIKKMLEKKLQENTQRHASAEQSVNFDQGRELVSVLVGKIEPNPYQPRRIFPQDELDKLAQSIAEVGLLEPILLRKTGDGYQIAAGERRWRAHKQIERRHIDAVVMEISDSDMAVFALAENIDREDLSDYEIGIALKQVEKAFPTKKKLAESLGLNRQDMYRYYAYDDLPAFIIEDLNKNPRLLSRSAANDIKRLLNENKDHPAVNDYLAEAWDLLLSSDLDQTKIAAYVARKLKGHETRDSHIQDAHNLIRDGKKVGNIARTEKHITVKLNTSVLNAEQEQKLKVFLEDLVQSEE